MACSLHDISFDALMRPDPGYWRLSKMRADGSDAEAVAAIPVTDPRFANDLAAGHASSVLQLPVKPLVGYPGLSYSAPQRTLVFAARTGVRSDSMQIHTQM